MHSMSEGKWNSRSPWPPKSMSSDQVQTTLKYDMQHANRGDNPWKAWAKEVRETQPEFKAQSCSTTWHTSAGGATAWGQKWDSASSMRDRSYQRSVPTSKNLTGSDYDTDREWHRSRMRYSSGWASDPTWSQSKRAKPTHTDPKMISKQIQRCQVALRLRRGAGMGCCPCERWEQHGLRADPCAAWAELMSITL